EAKVEIMDADTMKGKSKLLSLYKRLENKEVDILIGTQMIAKGHDLPGVTLVGIISADQSLGLPDFRSGERTFQLVTQVAGRAGRGDVPGKVVVQTYNPEHPSIKFALNHDSEGFLKQEMEIRRPLFYPPFSKLVNIKIKSSKEDEGKVFIKNLKTISRQLCSKLPENVSIELAGPSEAPIYRMQNKYRWQMLVKAENHNLLNIYCSKLYELLKNKKGSIKLSMDIDPYNF
ncbi:MAG: primosomal protein N', partial [Candidatus Dadabacteria bacterium]|nr:primosomal protein N' [Candidatus Dadabacteria bacterium]NIQ13142.1 primosomal protein N' [Candidatus Dadabacteria bacterium]